METSLAWTFHHKRILFAAGAVLILFALILSRPATITGHFTTTTYDQKAGLSAEESAAYSINGAQFTSFRVSGTIQGEGEVRIYLVEGLAQRLVYTNARDTTNKITGAVFAEPIRGVVSNKLTIKELEPELPALERTGDARSLPREFSHECQETCILRPTPGMTYRLLIQTEPGTSVTVSNVHYGIIEQV